jgi:hypothetical protein
LSLGDSPGKLVVEEELEVRRENESWRSIEEYKEYNGEREREWSVT